MPVFTARDGTDLYYNDWGLGLPVVLIHGWPLSSDSWEFQARVLAENGYRVITYDRRGFGKSDQPFTGYDYDTFASDLDVLLEELELSDVTLVGFSMGGGEVARYIGTYGEKRIAKAVFISAVTPYLVKTDDNPEGVDLKVFDGMVAGIKKDRADFMRTFSSMFYGRTLVNHSVSDGQLEFFQRLAAQASPKSTLDCVVAFSATDFRDDLVKFTVPTLVIHGTGDTTVPIDSAGRRTAQLVAHSQLIRYDGEPHGLTVTSAERVNQDLLTFLAS